MYIALGILLSQCTSPMVELTPTLRVFSRIGHLNPLRPQAWDGEWVLVVWARLHMANLSSAYIVQHFICITPRARSQFPEEIQLHLTYTLRLISKDLTDQLSKRLGVPHVHLYKSLSVMVSSYVAEQAPYPIYFQVLLLELPDLWEASRERRTDLCDDVIRCQRAPDMLQCGYFQLCDLKSYAKQIQIQHFHTKRTERRGHSR